MVTLKSYCHLVLFLTLMLICPAEQTLGQEAGNAVHENGVWTPEKVLAAIEWRESALTTFGIHYSEQLLVASKEGDPLKPARTHYYDLNASGNKVLLVDGVDDTIPSLSFKGQRYVWDGTTSRSVGEYKDYAGHISVKGFVTDRLPPSLDKGGTSFQMVKDLFPETRASTNLRRDLKDPEFAFAAIESFENGERIVRLTVRRQPPVKWYQVSEFEFEVEKDFFLRKYAVNYFNKKEDTKPALHWITTVEKAEQVEKIWIPKRIISDRFFEDGAHNQIICEIGSFTRVPMPKSEMKVDFPTGATIGDSISKSRYLVLPDGRHKQLPFFDADTGKSVEPATQATSTTQASVKLPGKD